MVAYEDSATICDALLGPMNTAYTVECAAYGDLLDVDSTPPNQSPSLFYEAFSGWRPGLPKRAHALLSCLAA